MRAAWTLTKRAWALALIFLPSVVTAWRLWGEKPARERWYARFVAALERGGATFIKLGQIASSRPDVVPIELCQHLAKLHDKAPAHAAEVSRQIVEAAFGRRVEDSFPRFDPEPIASGSIAQVHKAVMPDGTAVAMKIRHPDVERLIAMDLEIIRFVARQLNRIPTAKWLSFPEAAERFGASLHGQVDLLEEARHLQRFRKNFEDRPEVCFPRPIEPYLHATVIVETFEDAAPLAVFLANPHPANPRIARMGLQCFLQMIFRDGFVHADLHPGNLMVRLVDGEPQIVVLDCGMVAALEPHHRRNFTEFFAAIAAGDGARAAELMILHAEHHACPDPEKFKAEMGALLLDARSRPIQEIEVAAILSRILVLVRKHRIKIESAFTAVNVGIMVLEGVGRQLDPTIDLVREATPFLFTAMAELARERVLAQAAAEARAAAGAS